MEISMVTELGLPSCSSCLPNYLTVAAKKKVCMDGLNIKEICFVCYELKRISEKKTYAQVIGKKKVE